MPDDKNIEVFEEIENSIRIALRSEEGYLYFGRETYDNLREIYFACKEFRKASKILNDIAMRYSDRYEIQYEIYKDKYWSTFDRFA